MNHDDLTTDAGYDSSSAMPKRRQSSVEGVGAKSRTDRSSYSHRLRSRRRSSTAGIHRRRNKHWSW